MRSQRALRVLLLIGTLVVAACANPTTTSPPSVAPVTAVPETLAPGAGDPTREPVSPEPSTGEPATPEPATEPPVTEEPAPTGAPPEAGECTGSEENLAFYADFARVVDWEVYCPVLPEGWFVGAGQWRQAEGGRLEISYRGPRGAGLMLQEGSFCPGDGDCVPPGEELGPTPFGDRDGTLLETDDGWAVVAARGERPSWLLTLSGVGEEAARRIAADVVPVGD